MAASPVQPGQVRARKPDWLKKRIPDPQAMREMRALLDELKLNTICEEAGCPNIGECWAQRTATFLILGDICTRACGFCDVKTGRPEPVNVAEPYHVARAVKRLGLSHVVITSPDRDDLPDKGSEQFAATIRAVHRLCPGTTVEVLTSDFDGIDEHLIRVLDADPEIFAHNVETVPRLHRKVRPRFRYERSLKVLARAKELRPDIYTKSNIMVGLGERKDEVIQVMRDMRDAGCDFLTIGQYLQPSPKHLPVVEYVHPDVFEEYRAEALALGFLHVASGPFVRSSFDAATALEVVGRKRGAGTGAEAPPGGISDETERD
ncbi:MAG: lipoyl synthase [Clostridia bacterium]|nr:lipoyl synthase [Bacillota bacterium]MBO2521370.1 lipoyl synthase [Bacillota bacterium]